MATKIPVHQNHETQKHEKKHGIASCRLIGFARRVVSTRSLVQMEKQAKR